MVNTGTGAAYLSLSRLGLDKTIALHLLPACTWGKAYLY